MYWPQRRFRSLEFGSLGSLLLGDKGKGGRRKEEGGRRKEEGGRRKEEGGRGRKGEGRRKEKKPKFICCWCALFSWLISMIVRSIFLTVANTSALSG